MRKTKLAIAMAMMPFAAWGQAVPAISPVASVDTSLSNKPITLGAKEQRALQLVREWKRNPDKPIRASDGGVEYVFGVTIPFLICAPMRVCSIRLQPGERVINTHIGDKARWHTDYAKTGNGSSTITNVIVKPTDSGLVTNMIITTDRRSYMIELKSARHEFMPWIGFVYPEEGEAALAKYKAESDRVEYGSTLRSGHSIESMDFNFKLGGDKTISWWPQRVYTNGTKTVIQISSTKFGGEVPALVALGVGNGVFSGPDTQQINYRYKDGEFVVDGVFPRLALISGVGGQQQEVTIDYTGKGSK
ncbi:MAG TPA: P-type conjugative transfer protein TrbG [Nitrosospira sp.]|nr:P-type conjugative transfer protein TrbG [Nitrosospira sp.]